MTPPLPLDEIHEGTSPAALSSISYTDGRNHMGMGKESQVSALVLAADPSPADVCQEKAVQDEKIDDITPHDQLERSHISISAPGVRLSGGFRRHPAQMQSLPEVFSSVKVPFLVSVPAEGTIELQRARLTYATHSSSSSDLQNHTSTDSQGSTPLTKSVTSSPTASGALSPGGAHDDAVQNEGGSYSKHLWRIRSMLAWLGVGLIISVGYMDPGNWQTDLSGGASFYYSLLFVILFANLAAILLQHLALKLGIAAERDLAQACRDAYSPRVCQFLWITTEIAILATDLAEVTGSAIALQLLFGIALPWGCIITAVDVLVILLFNQRSFRYMEVLVGLLMLFIFVCFLYEIALAKPVWGDVFFGFLPSTGLVTNSAALFNAIGILGATVMPHNLYLHSAIVQTRAYPRTVEGKQWALRYAGIDSAMSLTVAFLVNAAILILAAAVFYTSGQTNVAELQDAYVLLSPTMGARAASTIFALALLASGQQATITGTLAGQVVMEGFVNIKLKPWQRRLVTRLLAIVPAVLVTSIAGASSVASLLIISQVILSFQLTFSIIPLVHFTSMTKYVGEAFVNPRWLVILSVLLCITITVLNGVLIVDFGINPGL